MFKFKIKIPYSDSEDLRPDLWDLSLSHKLDNIVIYNLYNFKTAADAKKKTEDPKMDDNTDPSAGIMNVSILENVNLNKKLNLFL